MTERDIMPEFLRPGYEQMQFQREMAAVLAAHANGQAFSLKTYIESRINGEPAVRLDEGQLSVGKGQVKRVSISGVCTEVYCPDSPATYDGPDTEEPM